MKILVYGAGAVGLGIASCLLKAGKEVTVLARGAAESLKREGLYRSGIFGEARFGPEGFETISSLLEAEGGQFDFILVCTKSYDSRLAAEDIARHGAIVDKGLVVLFQNGWGNAEVFAGRVAREKIYNARVITGFIKPSPNHVDITAHAEPVRIGSLYREDFSAVEGLCRAIESGGIPCEAVPDIGRAMWAKMLYNCALNPLSAIFGVPYGELAARGGSRRIMEMIVSEIFPVMKAAGHDTYWAAPGDYLDELFNKLIPVTAGHLSSTLQDLRAGRRTEIDALNGAVVRLGIQHRLDVTANSVVCNLIGFLEQKKG